MSRGLVVSVLSSLALVWGSGCSDSGSDDEVTSVDEGVTAPSAVFMSDEALSSLLGDPNVQVVDVRSKAAYDAAHIASALHLESGSLRASVDGVPGQVTDLATSEAAFAAAGLDPDSHIVLYGASTDTSVTRVYWTLKYYGHAAVTILDGGIDRWPGTTESGADANSGSEYAIAAADELLRVDADWVLDHLDDASVFLVDARSSEEFDAGRIPGALSVNWTRNVGSGSLLATEQVRQLYAAIDADATVVTYCQTGSRAAVAYAVLRWLGFADVRVYDGSWAEWGSRDDLPQER